MDITVTQIVSVRYVNVKQRAINFVDYLVAVETNCFLSLDGGDQFPNEKKLLEYDIITIRRMNAVSDFGIPDVPEMEILQCVTFNYSECNGNQNRFAAEYSCNVLCEGLKRPLQDECFEPLDRGHWCQSMPNRYYYNFETNTCTSFLGKSRNIFTTQQECEKKYNITGETIQLTSYLCLMESDSIFHTQILSITNGDEKCHLVQLWLKGIHLY
ncbi:unnamed protein product [Acanthocheilonema viteae]|uniref:BPTI/Kunitz inhibitor domain-containing protein n=1 Tax=Acanthocheilonema viteae TaxID=6277 RepID=A0A498SMK2_ACAVI|nr:unnamed protein product [Acanthocheilonema viteae]